MVDIDGMVLPHRILNFTGNHGDVTTLLDNRITPSHFDSENGYHPFSVVGWSCEMVMEEKHGEKEAGCGGGGLLLLTVLCCEVHYSPYKDVAVTFNRHDHQRQAREETIDCDIKQGLLCRNRKTSEIPSDNHRLKSDDSFHRTMVALPTILYRQCCL